MGDLVLAVIKAVEELAPGMKDIFDAPVGSEIGWLYDKEGKHVGCYDMVLKKNVTIEEILKK